MGPSGIDPGRSERIHGDDRGDVETIGLAVAGLDDRAAALTVPGKPDIPIVHPVKVFARRIDALIDEPLDALQHVALLDRPLVGGDDDVGAVERPFDQPGLVALEDDLADDVALVPTVGPGDDGIEDIGRARGLGPGPDDRTVELVIALRSAFHDLLRMPGRCRGDRSHE